jgi:hypothetical protein
MPRLITHVFNEGLPREGFRKLTYITISDEPDSAEEYFLGIDNNPLSIDEIDLMMQKKQIFPLSVNYPYPQLPKNKSVFVDKCGILYFANRLDADKDRVKIENKVNELLDMLANTGSE